MCGIIGYVGDKPCVDLIFSGLKRLEYRGYDSAGIAVNDRNAIALVKSEGKLAKLEGKIASLPQKASVGMGHTRWATHGPANTVNAHPHVTDELAIVHNGIIENYRDLKNGLEAAGVTFTSETDTEVVLHLLKQELNQADNTKDAIVNLISKLKGAFSLGILVPSENDRLYVVKQGSPLVIGVGEGENFFASDVAALVDHTKLTVVLNDGEMACVSKKGVEMWDFHGNPKTYEVQKLDWTADAMEKAGYPTYMLKEIHEQPAKLAAMIQRMVDLETGEIHFDAMGLKGINFDRVKYIHILGCGSAYLSGVIGKYLIEEKARIPVNVELASEFRYREPFVSRDTLVIAISQSGETLDTLECIKHARKSGCQVLSICNKPHTEIPRNSDATLYMECGPEIGVASTKAFTGMVLSQFFLANAFAQKCAGRTAKECQEDFDALRMLPIAMQEAMDRSEEIRKLAMKYHESIHFLYLGRGENFAIAYEGALKLKEISYIHAEAYGAGELKHGPIALVDQNMPILAIASQDRYYDKTIANIEEVKAREGRVIGLGDEDDAQLKELCDDVLTCRQLHNPGLQAIVNSIPLQLFAYHIADLRGTDVDQPRNLAKSVTVE